MAGKKPPHPTGPKPTGPTGPTGSTGPLLGGPIGTVMIGGKD